MVMPQLNDCIWMHQNDPEKICKAKKQNKATSRRLGFMAEQTVTDCFCYETIIQRYVEPQQTNTA